MAGFSDDYDLPKMQIFIGPTELTRKSIHPNKVCDGVATPNKIFVARVALINGERFKPDRHPLADSFQYLKKRVHSLPPRW
jgi:hypothetical protein